MSEEILINVTPRETRVGVVENGMLQEVHVERAGRRGFVGNIYCGRVQRVMPGMQAAFVEIGLARAAFLHASDIVRAPPALTAEEGEANGATAVNGNAAPHTPPIGELVREGQRIIVQVIKDPIGGKGARLSAQLSIPSRYLVLLPHTQLHGVSVRIEDEVERTRLKELLARLSDSDQSGYIARTNAEGEGEAALAEDIVYVRKVWQAVQENIARAEPGACVYEEPALPLRVLRDLMQDDIEKVRVDSRETWQRTLEFAQRFMPHLAERIEHYAGERPIFDLYGVEDEM
ncbi:MAG: ribonuclease E/G, partial [Rhodanobacteraceae bacterium]